MLIKFLAGCILLIVIADVIAVSLEKEQEKEAVRTESQQPNGVTTGCWLTEVKTDLYQASLDACMASGGEIVFEMTSPSIAETDFPAVEQQIKDNWRLTVVHGATYSPQHVHLTSFFDGVFGATPGVELQKRTRIYIIFSDIPPSLAWPWTFRWTYKAGDPGLLIQPATCECR